MSAQQTQNRGIVRLLQAENIKRLKAVEITPEGNLVVIRGNNGQGKTSVLDSIEMALGGAKTIPDKPIREGEDHARIVLETDELIITRTFNENGSYLKVKNRDGASFTNGQEVLNNLVGKFRFDPLAFTRMKPSEQAQTLRDLVGINTSELDQKRKVAFDIRRDINRDIKRFEAVRERTTHHEGVGDTEKSAAEILKSIEDANQGNGKIRELDTYIATRTQNIEAIDKQIDEATKRSDELTEEIECIDAEKAQLIREASFPVEGLGFGEEGITYNTIPFDQASAAEQIRVSVAIGLAMNPNLRFVRISDGSLLDSKSLAMIRDMAQEHDAQVFMERVGEGEECQVIIEDGMVKGGAS